MKKRSKIIIIIIAILAAGIIFYWYSYRPSYVVSKCSIEAKGKAIEKYDGIGEKEGKFRADDRDTYYKWCLQEKGLVK